MLRPTIIFLGALLLLGISHAQDDEEDGVSVEAEPMQTIPYTTPDISGNFYESFDNEKDFDSRWVKSGLTKDGSDLFKYDGEWARVLAHELTPGDFSLMTNSKAKHHAYAAKLPKPFNFAGNKPFIFQYEVQFRNGQECGGAYVKLLSSSGDLSKLNDKSPYSIMFGPDKCGSDKKLHFIFNHKNPKNGTLAEKHWKDSDSITSLGDLISDKNWHLLRLELFPDNRFAISVDGKTEKEGNLLEDFRPEVNPPKMIDDPNDSKPEDWDEREKIPDPEATKPADWDEDAPRKITDSSAVMPSDWEEDTPENIPDPESKIPDDWDVEMDGEWEAPRIKNPACEKISGCGKWSAPLIDNPNYKGKWKAPMITNPNYKGKWAPKKIQNPHFFEDLKPFHRLSPIDAVFFELWTISDGIAFDNLLITDDLAEANKLMEQVFDVKKSLVSNPPAYKENFVIDALRYARDNPWMWGVYLLVVAIPLFLFIRFCCVSPISKKDVDYGKAKKTDEPTPDDYVEEDDGVQLVEEDEEVENEDAVEDGGDEAVQKPATPSSSAHRRARLEK